MNALGECACAFFYIWKTLERNTYTAPHVVNIPFIMEVSKFISVNEMRELVIVKDLSYSDVSNMLQERNPGVKGISERSVRHFCTSNNIRKESNLSKVEFQKIISLEASKVWRLKYLLFIEIIVFLESFWKGSPKLFNFLDYIIVFIKIFII